MLCWKPNLRTHSLGKSSVTKPHRQLPSESVFDLGTADRTPSIILTPQALLPRHYCLSKHLAWVRMCPEKTLILDTGYFQRLETQTLQSRKTRLLTKASSAPAVWFPGSMSASLAWPLLRKGAERSALPEGRSGFLGFNEIIYCLLALTKTVNVTGEV